ncbi:MAG: MAPEG family protein [Alphaproteobacteria bacterium]|nr:MAPEG family protein [Alphaproteobacteria bacterium]
MHITPIYAGVATLFFVFLSIRVIGGRRDAHVGLGDGGNRFLQRRLRAHGNFAEYCPLGIVLMALAELQNTPVWTLHMIGTALIVGRLVHAYGVSREPEPIRLRVIGMVLTFMALISGALTNLGVGGITWILAG